MDDDGHVPTHPLSISPPVPVPGSVAADPDSERRRARMREITWSFGAREFHKRRDGMIHAMDGGLWLHRHVWNGRPMVHLVSTNERALLEYGRAVGIPASRLQFKPLKDPRTEKRRHAWHWDLGGPVLPPEDERLLIPPVASTLPRVRP